MKFAQYLHDTQTPEWKKAYIDYRGLKKRITVIRKSQQGLNFHVLPSDDSPDETPSPPGAPRASDVDSDDYEPSVLSHRNSVEDRLKKKTATEHVSPEDEGVQSNDLANALPASPHHPPVFASNRPKSTSVKERPSFNTNSVRVSGTRRGMSFSLNGPTSRHPNPLAALPLHELLTQLSPQEVSFFVLLDAQLDKVESFYLAREKEMLTRGYALKVQLEELQDHRKLFHEAQSQIPWTANIVTTIKSLVGLHRPFANATIPEIETSPPDSHSRPPRKGDRFKFKLKGKSSIRDVPPFLENTTTEQAVVSVREPQTSSSQASSSGASKEQTLKSVGKRKEKNSSHQDDDSGKDSTPVDKQQHEDTEKVEEDEQEQEDRGRHQLPLSADPDSYLYAKRRLKKAVLEHYRGLEVLHNYRVLNITGFRKALKKFEKVTKIPVQQQYMTEKVEKSSFASDKAVKQMMNDMEQMYATAFVRGDKKIATRRLRAGNSSKSHHFNAFRSGVFVGIALPALVEGLVKVFQQKTRETIPAWDALLYIYGIFLIPVLFAFLVGINLLVWSNSRINYVFIFEFNVLTQLDHRQYFEIPSILFASLCYAFWLSFSLIGYPHVSPTIWPLVWLVLALIIIFDPLPFLHVSSRYWLVKNVSKLFVSGTRPVEFTDFWMGDQFCSLVFTLSNLYFFVCVYADGFAPNWQKCGTSPSSWFIYFILASLPLFIRLVQSIKRYWDSGLITHLINGGKYASGILSYLFYYMWRRHQNERGAIFAFYCLSSVCYSVYASTWDFLMDWSVLRLHSKYPLLRAELLYTNYVPMYYFAIVSNVLIRFIWMLYIPKSGPNMMVRTFIGAFLEMLRRWQWNFYRLENEHLGNMDQYRVTREVPLPYAFNDRTREDDTDDEHHLKVKR